MNAALVFRRRAAMLAVLATLGLSACGGSDDPEDASPAGSNAGSSSSAASSAGASSSAGTSAESVVVPAEPAGLGREDSALAPAVLAYVDSGATNQRGQACLSTLDTNAGVRVLKGFLDLWAPRKAADGKVYVDAGVSAAADGTCPAVATSTWDGIPGSATDGTVLNAAIHKANIDYVRTATTKRSSSQALAAYLDDRRKKGYSVSDGMGPLTSVWRAGTGQTTTITAVDPDSAAPKVDDGGNNLGDTGAALGPVITFLDSGNIKDGSTEPPKRYYKYARPWRWSSDVVVVPALESAKSSTATTDGGFPSGHTAEAWRDTLAMAYVFPQRFQELVTRAMEMGENRIIAGMHSPLDVMGGRIHATAVVAYSLNANSAEYKKTNYDLVQNYLQKQTGAADFNALFDLAHTRKTDDRNSADYDRFADHAANKADFTARLTYGFSRITPDTPAPVVPKGAEVLLETRLPYLTATQRRVVLKSTAIAAGYPLGNDEEGWGRLNLFAAADGYGAFDGDVAVTMDASLGGFNARDNWRNDIAGAGRLNKLGSGTLRLAGSNSYSGGTLISAGTLAADSTKAFGSGDVFMKGGTLQSAAPGALRIGGAYTQTAGALELVMGSATNGTLQVGGNAVIAGGELKLRFSGYTPTAGTTLNVISAAKRSGEFASVSVAGFSKITTTYTATGVQIRLDAI